MTGGRRGGNTCGSMAIAMIITLALVIYAHHIA